jgi:hypothetical protein
LTAQDHASNAQKTTLTIEKMLRTMRRKVMLKER